MQNTSSPATAIDVRRVPRPMRHPLIFGTFDRLDPNNSFDIVSDHDPQPLRYLFDVRYPDAFSWNYIESGPDVWRIRIERLATEAALS